MYNLSNDEIKIAGVVKESIVDGPGIRYTIFTQGCPHHCNGCHNPQTHDFNAGSFVRISKIVEDIQKDPLLKGITISGGEPFMQAKKIATLISNLDRKKLNVMVYSGFEYEYLVKNANDENGYMDLLRSADILIDGKFEIDQKSEKLPFRGSLNQRSIDLNKSLESGNTVLYEF
ncbi:MAG: anaerobic ribonucleoside-triphosphate reductase activating protein [Clostridia bacterium]|nr:anaerobic ribonucleoside-triphosphate reductase activating protein [Clostridia bacterium]